MQKTILYTLLCLSSLRAAAQTGNVSTRSSAGSVAQVNTNYVVFEMHHNRTAFGRFTVPDEMTSMVVFEVATIKNKGKYKVVIMSPTRSSRYGLARLEDPKFFYLTDPENIKTINFELSVVLEGAPYATTTTVNGHSYTKNYHAGRYPISSVFSLDTQTGELSISEPSPRLNVPQHLSPRSVFQISEDNYVVTQSIILNVTDAEQKRAIFLKLK